MYLYLSVYLCIDSYQFIYVLHLVYARARAYHHMRNHIGESFESKTTL